MIDFLNNDGTGKTCIYGTSTFNDENLTTYKHDKPGMLCMANSGPNTNGCQVCYLVILFDLWINGHNYHIKIAPIIHSYISNLLSPSSPSFTLLVRMPNGSTVSIVCLDKYWMIMARV